jgi:TENA/THI-4/PQQC family
MFCACDGFIWATTLRNCSKVSKRGHPCLTWGTSGRAPAGAVAVERSLHEGFFARFGLSEEDVARTPMEPTSLACTSYLIATAYGGSFPELLGAVLPCYWSYWEVGEALLERGRRGLPLWALDRDLRR